MKYRIEAKSYRGPIVVKGIYYVIQVKKWYGWVTITDPIACIDKFELRNYGRRKARNILNVLNGKDKRTVDLQHIGTKGISLLLARDRDTKVTVI